MFTNELFGCLSDGTLESIILDLADTADERLRAVMLEAGDALDARAAAAVTPGENQTKWNC